MIISRPLFYLSEDEIHEVLTLFHLLHGKNLNSHKVNNERHVADEDTYCRYIKLPVTC